MTARVHSRVFFPFFREEGKKIKFGGNCGGLCSPSEFDDYFCEFFEMGEFFGGGEKVSKNFVGEKISPLRGVRKHWSIEYK